MVISGGGGCAIGRKISHLYASSPKFTAQDYHHISFQKNHELSGIGRTGNCLGFPGSWPALPCPAPVWPALIDKRKLRLCNLPKVSLFRVRHILEVLNCPGEARHTLREKLNNLRGYVIQANNVENVTDITGIVR